MKRNPIVVVPRARPPPRRRRDRRGLRQRPVRLRRVHGSHRDGEGRGRRGVPGTTVSCRPRRQGPQHGAGALEGDDGRRDPQRSRSSYQLAGLGATAWRSSRTGGSSATSRSRAGRSRTPPTTPVPWSRARTRRPPRSRRRSPRSWPSRAGRSPSTSVIAPIEPTGAEAPGTRRRRRHPGWKCRRSGRPAAAAAPPGRRSIEQARNLMASRPKLDEAEALLTPLKETKPSASLDYAFATLYHLRGKDDAATYVRAALAKDRHVRAHMLGRKAYEEGRTDEAITHFEAETRRTPTTRRACRPWPRSTWSRAAPDAVKAYEAVVAANPSNTDALVSLDRLYTSMGNQQKSDEAFQKVMAANPTGRPGLLPRGCGHHEASGPRRSGPPPGDRRLREGGQAESEERQGAPRQGMALVGVNKMDEAESTSSGTSSFAQRERRGHDQVLPVRHVTRSRPCRVSAIRQTDIRGARRSPRLASVEKDFAPRRGFPKHACRSPSKWHRGCSPSSDHHENTTAFRCWGHSPSPVYRSRAGRRSGHRERRIRLGPRRPLSRRAGMARRRGSVRRHHGDALCGLLVPDARCGSVVPASGVRRLPADSGSSRRRGRHISHWRRRP